MSMPCYFFIKSNGGKADSERKAAHLYLVEEIRWDEESLLLQLLTGRF